MNNDREPPNGQPPSPTTNTDDAWGTEFSVSDSSDDQLDIEGTDTESQDNEETDMDDEDFIGDNEDTDMEEDEYTHPDEEPHDQHDFEDNGVRRWPHHYTEYLYPHIALVPQSGWLYLTAPLDHERRIHPGPAPQDPEEYEIFSITQIPKPETGVFPDPEVKENNERNSHALAQAMIRVSHWPGESQLTMAIYNDIEDGHRTVCVSRYSAYKDMQNRLVEERARYEFDIAYWIDDRPAIPGRSKEWLEKLKSLETRCDNRTWRSVQSMFVRQNCFDRAFLCCYQWFNPEQVTVHKRTADEVYADVLSAVPIASLSQDATNCDICGDPFAQDGERPVQLPCMARHTIGEECAKKWIKPGKEGSCPLCRGKFPVLPMVQWPWWVLAERRLRDLETEWQHGTSQITVDALQMCYSFAWIIRLFWYRGTEMLNEETRLAMPYQLGESPLNIYVEGYENETALARETVKATLVAMNGITGDKQDLIKKLIQDFEGALLRDMSPMFENLERAPVPPGFWQYLARVLSLLVNMRPEDLEELEKIEMEQ